MKKNRHKTAAIVPDTEVLEFAINYANANDFGSRMEHYRKLGVDQIWQKEIELRKQLEVRLEHPALDFKV